MATLEEHLGNRKLYLNKRRNSVLANNFIKYLGSSFWILDDFSCVRDFQTEYGSQQLLSSRINGFTNNVSEKTLRLIRQENLNRIIIAHLNINSLRNKFDLRANQIIGNVGVLGLSETKLICFLLLKMLISQVMLMITHFMTLWYYRIQKKSYHHYKVHPKIFFNGYQIIRWRATLKSVIL